MNLNMDNTERNLFIESKNPLTIYGDIDILLKMKLHYVSREMFEQNIPKELQRHVPMSYIQNLK